MKNKKMNNKGFSLVELIIVIAIMAVLVGVLAPAYLRYVEKSRKSADVQAIDAVMSAMEAAAIDPSLNLADGDKMTVTLSASGLVSTATLNVEDENKKNNIEDELETTLGQYKLKGSWVDTTNSIVIEGTVDEGNVTFECDQKDAIAEYSADLAAQFTTTTTP